MSTLRKFSSQADPAVLEELQDIATREGRQFRAVLGDAPRRNVLEAFQDSRHYR
jgi:hypothetical protein